jgi:beta-glucanase (GH16 family)
MGWIITYTALDAINDLNPDLVSANFLGPDTYLICTSSTPALPAGWNQTIVVSVKDATQLAALVSGVDGCQGIVFDLEGWADTPDDQKTDKATLVATHQNAYGYCQANGLKMVATPGVDLTPQMDPTHTGPFYTRWNNVGMYTALAPYCDALDIQGQGTQNTLASYTSFVQDGAAQALAAHPGLEIIAGLSTTPAGGTTTQQQLLDAANSVKSTVTGFWMNVPGSSTTGNFALANDFLSEYLEATVTLVDAQFWIPSGGVLNRRGHGDEDPGGTDPTAQPDEANYSKVLNEQFVTLDPSRYLVYDVSNGNGNEHFGSPTRIQTYQNSNVSAGAGASSGATGGTSLRMLVNEIDAGSGTLPTAGMPPTGSAGTRYSYTAGMLDTRSVGFYLPRYLRVEWRAKIPHGYGLWPSFWLVAKNGGATTCEWDIVEYFHGQLPGQNSTTLHGTTNDGVYHKNRYTNNGAAGAPGRTFFETPTYTPGWHVWGSEIVPVTDSTGNTVADPTAPSNYVRLTVDLDGVEVVRFVDTSATWWTTNGGSADSFWNVFLQGCQVDGAYVGHPRSPLAYDHWQDICVNGGTPPNSCTLVHSGGTVQRAQFGNPASMTEIDYMRVWKRTAA